MSFTLSEFKSALGQSMENAAGITADFASKAVDSTVSTATKTGSALKGVMPATNKKVDNIAAKFNSRLNSVEKQQRIDSVKVSMIAQATGVNLPSDEEIMEALDEEDKAEQAAKTVEAVTKAVMNPELMDVIGMFAKKFLGVNPFDMEGEDNEDGLLQLSKEVETTLADESEIPEEVKVKAKVKKEEPKQEEEGISAPLKSVKKSGRKKLGMSAPLAD